MAKFRRCEAIIFGEQCKQNPVLMLPQPKELIQYRMREAITLKVQKVSLLGCTLGEEQKNPTNILSKYQNI